MNKDLKMGGEPAMHTTGKECSRKKAQHDPRVEGEPGSLCSWSSEGQGGVREAIRRAGPDHVGTSNSQQVATGR